MTLYNVKYNELRHHGIKGQEWGERRYQYEDGTYTPEGKARYFKTYQQTTGRPLMGNGVPSNVRVITSSSGKPKTEEPTEKPKTPIAPLATSKSSKKGKGKGGSGKTKKTEEEKAAEKAAKQAERDQKKAEKEAERAAKKKNSESAKKASKDGKEREREAKTKAKEEAAKAKEKALEKALEKAAKEKEKESADPIDSDETLSEREKRMYKGIRNILEKTGQSASVYYKNEGFDAIFNKYFPGDVDPDEKKVIKKKFMNYYKLEHGDASLGEYYAVTYPSSKDISHFGIQGQKWGVRRYQYEDGTYTPEGKERYFKSIRKTDTQGTSEYSVSKHKYITHPDSITEEGVKRFDDSIKKMNANPEDFDSLEDYDNTFFEGYDDLVKYEDISAEMAKKYIESGRDAAFDYLESEVGDMPVMVAMNDTKLYDLGVNFVDYTMKVMGESGSFNVEGQFQYTSSREKGKEKRDKGEMLSLDTTWDEKGLDYYEKELEKEKKRK